MTGFLSKFTDSIEINVRNTSFLLTDRIKLGSPAHPGWDIGSIHIPCRQIGVAEPSRGRNHSTDRRVGDQMHARQEQYRYEIGGD